MADRLLLLYNVVSDQFYPALGNNLYFSSPVGVTEVANAITAPTTTQNFGGTSFQFVSGLAVDASNSANQVVYIGDDPTNGTAAAQGRWFQVGGPAAPAAPNVPTGVTASAGDGQATVSWIAPKGQPITSYTVHNSFASNGIAAPDVIVSAQPGSTVVSTTATITGLTDGVSYQFEVLATNAQGSSAFSTPSNTVTPQAVTVPGAPTGVVASAGNASATVAWTAPANNGGSAISSYTVTAFTGGAAAGIAVTVAGSSTGAVVSGLTNGTAYTFSVHATNAIGNGPESAQSLPVTPAVPAATVPGAPTGVVANAGNASASVAWIAPANNGGSAITSYTVTALVGGAPTAITVTVPGTSTGANVSGLTNGTTYTFTVHATNSVGNSVESAPSAPVTPVAPFSPPDVAVSLSGPASVASGSNAIYTFTVSNLGPTAAPQVALTASFPTTGATLVALSSGACSAVTGRVNCTFPSMAAGTSAAVSVTLNVTAAITVSASVQATDAAGSAFTDPNPANNSASVSTALAVPAPTTNPDVQVTGFAQNGSPAVNTSDSFTFQIRNNQNAVANGVQFSAALPTALGFSSATTSLGTCTVPAPGTRGGTITCYANSLTVGQTMQVVINVTTPVSGSAAVTGSATFNGTDSRPSNNSATVVIGVR